MFIFLIMENDHIMDGIKDFLKKYDISKYDVDKVLMMNDKEIEDETERLLYYGVEDMNDFNEIHHCYMVLNEHKEDFAYDNSNYYKAKLILAIQSQKYPKQ